MLIVLVAASMHTAAAQETVTFEIREFYIQGNSIFGNDTLLRIVAPFIGAHKTAQDVENARTALEKYYHTQGYPTALVNIPEQAVEYGVVQLEVVESTIRRVRVKGNRYFTRENLLREMPAFAPGEILFLPRVKQQLARVNRNPDLKVAPVLMPGKKLGTIDVEFHVKDNLPLHGSLELNNRSTHDTSDLRLNAALRYDNLWQKEHSIAFQYQVSPQETDEVNLFTTAYTMPSFFNDDHVITAYGLVSKSETATVEDISVIGDGFIVGMRYMAKLPSSGAYLHDFVFGADYKKFKDDVAGEKFDLDYVPLHMSYTGRIPGNSGQTAFSLSMNTALRSLGGRSNEFEQKRAGTRGNFFYTDVKVERRQRIGSGWHIYGLAEARMNNRPLISNEQYIAGGMNSVRGYMESEASGDKGIRASIAFSMPDLGAAMKIGRFLEMTPTLFYDYAKLGLNEALDGEEKSITLQGAGIGASGYLFKYLEYRFYAARALKKTVDTDAGDYLGHFSVALKF